MSVPLLVARGVVKRFPVRGVGRVRSIRSWRGGRTLTAVAGVDLEVARGECLALVGESGSGKTTLGRCLLRLIEPDAGRVWLAGEELGALPRRALRQRRRALQMIFQDPNDSLPPRRRVGSILAEPVLVHRLAERGPAVARRVAELLDQVDLDAELARRYPHELSGGQRQRVGIARALATEPDLVIADEPVSGLDASVRGRVVDLLVDLQDRLGLGLLLISHDLAVVARIAHRVAVLYLGRVVEQAPTATLLAAPRHPYTAALLAAVPRLEGSAADLAARRPAAAAVVHADGPPSPLAPSTGCPYHPRCPIARPRCTHEAPALAPVGDGRVACHYPGEASVAGRDVPLADADGPNEAPEGTASP